MRHVAFLILDKIFMRYDKQCIEVDFGTGPERWKALCKLYVLVSLPFGLNPLHDYKAPFVLCWMILFALLLVEQF